MAKKTNKEKEDDKLTTFQQQFIDIWFRMNFNGRLAYKQLKPHVTNETADAEASRILSTEKAKDYIELKKEHIRIKEEVELSWIVSQLKSIVEDITSQDITRFDDEGRPLNKTDHRAKIEAIKTLAKIAGLEAPIKQDITSNGQTLIPEIKINIIQPIQDNEEEES